MPVDWDKRKRPSGWSRGPKKARPYVWIDTEKKARKYIKQIRKAPVAAVDTEFPPLGPRRHEVIIWSLSTGRDERYVLAGHLLKEGVMRDWITSEQSKLVWFNYKEDGIVVEDYCGADLDASFYADAMVMDWFVDETDPKHGLKHAGGKWLGWRRHDYAKLFSYVPDGKKKPIVIMPDQLMDGPLPDEMLREMSHADWIELFKHYAADDAEETWALFYHHKRRLKKIGYWENYLEIDASYTLTLRACEQRPVHVDMELLEDIKRAVSVEMLRLKTQVRHATGKPDLNVQSGPQMQQLIFEELGWPTYDDLKTDKGAPQLNQAAYARYVGDHGFQIAAWMLQYNKLKTKKGTFLTGMQNGVAFGPGKDIGALHTNFNQIGAESGRISSRKYEVTMSYVKEYKTRPSKVVHKKVKAGMNIQNIPAPYKDDFKIRRCIIPPPPDDLHPEGYKLVVADYSGFELWMVLYCCWKWGIESKMLEHLMRGDDVHGISGQFMLDLPCHWSDMKTEYPRERGMGKNANFGLCYGAGLAKFMALLGWDVRVKSLRERAKKLMERWLKLWPEMLLYQRMAVKIAYDRGYHETISGRRRRLKDGLAFWDEDEEKRNRVVNHYENIAKNIGGQGNAADIVKVAMNYVEADDELYEMGYRQLFPVHDEIVGYAPASTADKCLERKLWIMQQPFKNELPFELQVEGSTGDNWAEAK